MKPFFVALGLAVLAALPYARVGTYEFIQLDDYAYVVMNAHVRTGLTWENVGWAFSSLTRSNWHPLTWLSHMLDVTLFGMDAGWHHAVNVLFHSLTAALLFLAFYRSTGAVRRSAFVAALFAVHPLHVESVAWIAERKDVLSGFFFAATLLAYAEYARTPGPGSYMTALLLFGLGLMAKPMLVTVPLVLLLIDVWPLGRTSLAAPADGSARAPLPWRKLLIEKAPFAGLALACSAVTFAAQQESGTVATLHQVSLIVRIENALLSYVAYLVKALWPSSLAVFYPHPANGLILWQAAGSALALAAFSYMFLRRLRKRPFLAVGWLWYLIMLLPVIGFIQVGQQARADRYTYLPLIGPFLMIAWFAADTVRSRWPSRMKLLVAASAVILAALCAASFAQAEYWQNGITLFTHTLSVTSDNAVAYKSLGCELGMRGRNREAVAWFEKSLRINNADVETHRDLGLALAATGRMDEAIDQFREAVVINPRDRISRYYLEFYARQEKGAEAF